MILALCVALSCSWLLLTLCRRLWLVIATGIMASKKQMESQLKEERAKWQREAEIATAAAVASSQTSVKECGCMNRVHLILDRMRVGQETLADRLSAITSNFPISTWSCTSVSTTAPSSVSRSKLPPTASLLETWRQLALHEDTMSSGNVELLGDNVEILHYEPEGEAPTAEQFPAAGAEDESPPMPMVFTVDNLRDNIATADPAELKRPYNTGCVSLEDIVEAAHLSGDTAFLSRPLEMPAEGATFHDEDKLAALFAWDGIKQLVRAQFPPPHTVAFGHIYHTPHLAKLPPSSRQSVFQLLFALRRDTFREGPRGTSVVTQEGGLQLPLARAASTNDFNHDLQAPRQASSRPAHGSEEDKDFSRSAAPVSKSWKNR
ncbi:unnamed protein product [Ectocarpus sp. CCAP 1310/34]|nr:unnamed protein product [Ectocarpus sp. CCAP 1310/34]